MLRPRSMENYPTVSINLHGINEKETRKILNQFLSILSWIDGQSAELTYGIIGISPGYVGKPNKMSGVKPYFAFEAFKRSILNNPKQKLALALHREAVTVNSVPYKFLSFFKIIGICLGEDKETNKKLNCLIEKLDDERTLKRIKYLKEQKGIDDIASYLYQDRRNAISHVVKDPILNPDEEDAYELFEDISIVKAAAEYIIEKDLNVSRNFWLIG